MAPPPPLKYVVWGAGGHGRVVADVLRATGAAVVAWIDRDPAAVSVSPAAPVISEDEFHAMMRGAVGVAPDVQALALGIGGNEARLRCLDAAAGLDLSPTVHPSAVVSPSATLGVGTVVMPGAIVNSGARIGRAVIVNSGAIVEHDCVLEDGVHLSPGAVLAGGVHVGICAWIGASATIIQGRNVGEYAVVGAGAVVIRDVPACVRVVGVPAHPMPPHETDR